MDREPIKITEEYAHTHKKRKHKICVKIKINTSDENGDICVLALHPI